jgi:hypothetical protein
MLSVAEQESSACPVACCTKLVGIKDGGQDSMKNISEASRGRISFPHVTSDLLSPTRVLWTVVIIFFVNPDVLYKEVLQAKAQILVRGGPYSEINPLLKRK